ncbi:hypothetical protein [Litorimonas haliclonae]|uniref:hypothetical protein n=1 Tax=Litorimonas haliclonae TaxID=2081977 RepID=UPI0039EE2539
MTNLIFETGAPSIMDRPPLHFHEAVCVWVDHHRGLTEPQIAAKYGVCANSVSSVLTELTHEGAEKAALAVVTEGYGAAGPTHQVSS